MKNKRDSPNYKSVQLCEQVKEALDLALMGSTNPILRDLLITSVLPLRGVACLEIRVEMNPESPHDVDEIKTHLKNAMGYLRSAMAAEIHRKKVPSLEFTVVPPTQFSDEEY